MSPPAPLLASILAASLLLAVAPTAQAGPAVEPPVCQHVVTGPDIHFGVCTDPTAECGLWTYNYGGETCYAPGAGVVPRAHCERLLYGPDIDQGVCYDLDGEYVDGMECAVWWYSAYSTGQDKCYVPAPPLAAPASAAYHNSQPIVCVGDEGPELPGVCYDPDDYDDCDVYAGLGGGNQVCLVPAQNTCPSSTPEWPGVCWTPRQECQLWIGLGGVYCLYPVSASTAGVSADVAPPRAYCQQVLVGPDVDQGLCYDAHGEEVNGEECLVWWYNTFGSDTCHVPALVSSGPDGTCYRLDADGGVCHDTTRDTCQVWAYGAGPDRCLT